MQPRVADKSPKTFTMPVAAPLRFEKRQLQQWLEMAGKGEIALPSFQRGYVWKRNQSIADYLLAVFEGRPTGIFLLLLTNGDPQFPSRTLRGVESSTQQAKELILDGQQRLTSLWKAFNGTAAVTYYVQVESLVKRDMSVLGVKFFPEHSTKGRKMEQPKNAYTENLVPLSILLDKKTENTDLGAIWNWCERVYDDANSARRLENTIRSLREELLLRRDLHYCELPADIDRDKAVEIFIQSNRSSVKVNEFDIAVALAMNKGEENLREQIDDFNQQSEVTSYYVKADDDDSIIASLGEWALFAACIGEKQTAPKKGRFDVVIEEIFGPSYENGRDTLEKLLKNVEAALNTLADHGAKTRQTLPAVPTLHVVAALQDSLKCLTKANQKSISNRLISAYLWRSYFTERYEARANDRLYQDYKALWTCIKEIEKTGTFACDQVPVIFKTDEYPLPDATTLGKLDVPIPWIKSASRLGRAVAAITLHNAPKDWITRETLDTRKIRELERSGKLDRHHIFPRDILKGKVTNEAINHGLNGVLMTKPTNQSLSKKDPADYMKWILDQPGASDESELRRIVQSHLVPYDAIMAGGNIKRRDLCITLAEGNPVRLEPHQSQHMFLSD